MFVKLLNNKNVNVEWLIEKFNVIRVKNKYLNVKIFVKRKKVVKFIIAILFAVQKRIQFYHKIILANLIVKKC
jgi:hypothetical protein